MTEAQWRLASAAVVWGRVGGPLRCWMTEARWRLASAAVVWGRLDRLLGPPAVRYCRLSRCPIRAAAWPLDTVCLPLSVCVCVCGHFIPGRQDGPGCPGLGRIGAVRGWAGAVRAGFGSCHFGRWDGAVRSRGPYRGHTPVFMLFALFNVWPRVPLRGVNQALTRMVNTQITAMPTEPPSVSLAWLAWSVAC